jgi:hypothetical protein
MALELAAPPRRISTAVHRVDGAAVLVLTGRLDRADPAAAGSSAEAALTAVEACLSERPVGVVVDVSRVELSRFTVGLLGLVRGRTARVRVPLLLADVPTAGLEVLERSGVADLYPAFPSISSALESLATRPAPAV